MAIGRNREGFANDEGIEKAFEAAGADAILVDGLEDLGLLKKLSRELARPIMFNQIAGGKSPQVDLSRLKECGVSLVNYSTPCLFAAQGAVDKAIAELACNAGALPQGGVGVPSCTAVLKENLARRDTASSAPMPTLSRLPVEST